MDQSGYRVQGLCERVVLTVNGGPEDGPNRVQGLQSMHVGARIHTDTLTQTHAGTDTDRNLSEKGFRT